MNSKKSKGCLIFFVLILLAIVAFFINFYFKAQKIQKENEINAKIIKQQQIAHQKEIDQLCVFPTGYAPTVSGYFFKIKEYQDYMCPFIDEAVKRAGKDTYQILPIKINYKINDNKCYVQGFSLSGLWDGKKIIPNFYHHYASFPPKPLTELNIEVFYDVKPLLRIKKASTAEDKQVFWLKNYKNLYFTLDKKMLDKQGNYLARLGEEHHIFYVTNFENEGLEYRLPCLGLRMDTESFPISTDKLQERKAQHQWGCSSSSRPDSSRVIFEGGSIISDFSVHVLSDIVLFLNSLKAVGVQFTAKGDKK